MLKLPRSGYRPCAALLYDGAGYLSALREFSITKKKCTEGFLFIGIHYLIGRKRCLWVHSHIQRALKPSGETTLGSVKLVGGYPKIGQDTIYLLYPIETQEAFYMSEILWDKGKPLIIYGVLLCLRVLVKSQQTASTA